MAAGWRVEVSWGRGPYEGSEFLLVQAQGTVGKRECDRSAFSCCKSSWIFEFEYVSDIVLSSR